MFEITNNLDRPAAAPEPLSFTEGIEHRLTRLTDLFGFLLKGTSLGALTHGRLEAEITELHQKLEFAAQVNGANQKEAA